MIKLTLAHESGLELDDDSWKLTAHESRLDVSSWAALMVETFPGEDTSGPVGLYTDTMATTAPSCDKPATSGALEQGHIYPAVQMSGILRPQ